MVSSPPPTSMTSSVVVGVEPPLRPMSSSLYGSSASSARASSSVTTRRAKRWPRLDDLLHALLERREVVGGERALDVEVVVEAVADRRADAELGLREQLLHRLREHVRGRVPQHRAAVLGVDRRPARARRRRPRRRTGRAARRRRGPRRSLRSGKISAAVVPSGTVRLVELAVEVADGDAGHGALLVLVGTAVTKGRPGWIRRVRGAGGWQPRAYRRRRTGTATGNGRRPGSWRVTPCGTRPVEPTAVRRRVDLALVVEAEAGDVRRARRRGAQAVAARQRHM